MRHLILHPASPIVSEIQFCILKMRFCYLLPDSDYPSSLPQRCCWGFGDLLPQPATRWRGLQRDAGEAEKSKPGKKGARSLLPWPNSFFILQHNNHTPFFIVWWGVTGQQPTGEDSTVPFHGHNCIQISLDPKLYLHSFYYSPVR